MSKKVILIFSLTAVLIAIMVIALIINLSGPQDTGKDRVSASQTNTLPMPTTPIAPVTPTPAAPAPVIKPNTSYQAILDTTDGKITIDLFASQTPITVNNFVYLSQKGFYNNTIFHRVISGFMIQGGDPNGNGSGGPGYNIPDEPVTGNYTRGTVAMANTGLPNSGGSQFFIMHQDYPLQKSYTIFGRVIKGLDVVDKIATASVSASPTGEKSVPVSPVKILSVQITEKTAASSSAATVKP